jgi:hypothetical protein
MRLLSWGLIVTAVLWSGELPAAGRVHELEYPPRTEPGGLAYGVTYRLWIPAWLWSGGLRGGPDSRR